MGAVTDTIVRIQKQVRVDPELWLAAKVRAVTEQKELSAFVEEALREALKKPRK